MTEEDEKFYEDVFTITGRPEWKTVQEHFQERLDAVLQRAIDAADIETLYWLKGQRDILREITEMRNVMEQQQKYSKGELENGLSV